MKNKEQSIQKTEEESITQLACKLVKAIDKKINYKLLFFLLLAIIVGFYVNEKRFEKNVQNDRINEKSNVYVDNKKIDNNEENKSEDLKEERKISVSNKLEDSKTIEINEIKVESEQKTIDTATAKVIEEKPVEDATTDEQPDKPKNIQEELKDSESGILKIKKNKPVSIEITESKSEGEPILKVTTSETTNKKEEKKEIKKKPKLEKLKEKEAVGQKQQKPPSNAEKDIANFKSVKISQIKPKMSTNITVSLPLSKY